MGLFNNLGLVGTPKPSGGSNLIGLPKSGSAAKGYKPAADKKPIRQTTHFISGGSEYRALRERVKKIGTINAIIKGPDGKMVHKKLKDKELFDQIKRAIGTSGISSEAWQRRLQKNKSFTAIDKSGSRRTYIISGPEIKKRQALGRVFHPDGPTREQIAAEEKHDEKIRRLNVLETQLGREREDQNKVIYLKNRREKGAKNSIDLRSGEKKITASDIGVEGKKYFVSAQGGGGTADASFANKAESPEAENQTGKVIGINQYKNAKKINEKKDIPMFLTGTHG